MNLLICFLITFPSTTPVSIFSFVLRRLTVFLGLLVCFFGGGGFLKKSRCYAGFSEGIFETAATGIQSSSCSGQPREMWGWDNEPRKRARLPGAPTGKAWDLAAPTNPLFEDNSYYLTPLKGSSVRAAGYASCCSCPIPNSTAACPVPLPFSLHRARLGPAASLCSVTCSSAGGIV